MELKVTTDMEHIADDVNDLEQQLLSLQQTVRHLNDNGVKLSINMKIKGDKLAKDSINIVKSR